MIENNECCKDYVSKNTAPQQTDEDIAKAFQIGLALGFGKNYDEMDKIIDEIKKVTEPKQKIGHWIFKHFDEETGISDNYWCSECGKPLAQVYKTYCSNCGTKMIESDEIEEVKE